MKRIAPLKGFGGYQGLMRAYVGSGLSEDMEQLEGSAIAQLIEKMREEGVSDETLDRATSSIMKPVA